MKKISLFAVVIMSFYGCKKNNINKATQAPTAADSIYLVSSIKYTEVGYTDTINYYYNNNNELSKYVFRNKGVDSVIYNYNTDGTVSTIFRNGSTLNVTYNNGLPATNYVSGAPVQTDKYTIVANKVAQVDYYEPIIITRQIFNHEYYSYDSNNNLTSDTYVALVTNFGDSAIVVRTYNTHKNAFYYLKNKLIVGNERFISVPLGGGNDYATSTFFQYYNGTIAIQSAIAMSSTYNTFDMPIETKSSKDGTPIETIDYSYIEKKK